MNEWKQFLQAQEKEFGKPTVDRWLVPLTVVRFDACNLYLEAADSFQVIWFEEYIRPKLKSFINSNGSLIRVHLTNKKDHIEKGAAKKVEKETFSLQFDTVDPAAQLENFLITEENEIPLKLIQEACSTTSHTGHNPLYLYGAAGVGKTHLLMSLVHACKKNNRTALYITAETFAQHVVKAIRSGEMTKFREIYRKVDVLIVDDIDTLAKRAATQEEFFHTFNTLHNSNRLLVLSSQKPPQNLTDIEPRLMSRFEWGLLLHICPLKKKELANLLQRRALKMSRTLPERAIDFLLENFSTVHSLLQAQAALFARTLLKPKTDTTIFSIPSMKSMLSDLIEREQTCALTSDKILDTVSKHFGLCLADLTGKSQSRECTNARKLAMYICRQKLNMPYMSIGDLFQRDHSTVMSAIKQVEKGEIHDAKAVLDSLLL